MSKRKPNKAAASDRKSNRHYDMPLTVRDLIRCVKSVLDVTTTYNVSLFGQGMPTESEYRQCINKINNVHITDNDLGLNKQIQGAVFKRDSSRTRTGEALYLIYLSKKLCDPLKRVFVLSHEVGHVMLHGRLMHPGMMLNLSSQDWRPDCKEVKSMEAEANIFALMTVMPDTFIEAARSQDSTTAETAQFLHTQMIHRYGQSVSKNLINDRLLIHKLSYSETWNLSLEDVIDTTNVRSWICRDTNYLGHGKRFY